MVIRDDRATVNELRHRCLCGGERNGEEDTGSEGATSEPCEEKTRSKSI
jgi:hypothetical protein